MERTDIVTECKEIFLRKITVKDAPLIVKWRNNERVRENFIYREKFTLEGQLRWQKTMVDTGKVAQYIICEKPDGRPVGSVYFRDIDPVEMSAEYGIFIGEDDALGKGYGNITAVLATDYAKETLKLRRVILRVFTRNLPALNSYKNAGFHVVSELPGVECSDGQKDDMILMEKSLFS
ncbi:MAG: GNAT family N-acetyltransferase [Butyrivibrio sp.]|nr:GNAT family N-acetyltransferase [Butyrivibrio sp.]